MKHSFSHTKIVTHSLITLSLASGAGTTELAIFNALHLSDDPIATAMVRSAMLPGLHGSFAAARS